MIRWSSIAPWAKKPNVQGITLQEDIPEGTPDNDSNQDEGAGYQVYIDGSIIKGQINGGAGYVIHSKDGTIIEDRKAADALCSAALSALARLTVTAKEGQHIDIFTDCQSLVYKMKKGPQGQDLRPLDEAWKFLKQIGDKRATVCISWIPGHDDIEGNEKVDTLAREARYKHQATVAVDYKTIKSRHESELNKSWRDSVDHSKWNIRRSIEGQFTRQERTTLAQIRTGHCVLLKSYRKRIGLEDDGTCETCKIEKKDREHLLGKYPAWSREQRETFGKTFLFHRELIKADPADIIAFLRWIGRIGRIPPNDSA